MLASLFIWMSQPFNVNPKWADSYKDWISKYTWAFNSLEVASFPGSPEREINMCGEPGIFSYVIKIGPEFSEQKGNVLRVIQPALRSMLGVYDICPPIVIYM